MDSLIHDAIIGGGAACICCFAFYFFRGKASGHVFPFAAGVEACISFAAVVAACICCVAFYLFFLRGTAYVTPFAASVLFCICCFAWYLFVIREKASGQVVPFSPAEISEAEAGAGVDIVDDNAETATLPTSLRSSIPTYWNNAGSSTHFDQMVCVTEPASKQELDRMLMASYVPKVTRDRPCPSGRCRSTPGGCPCVQPGGVPGLPDLYGARRIIRVEDSCMWQRYVERRCEIKAKREGHSFHPIEPNCLTDEIADEKPEVFSPLDSSLNEVYLWHGTHIRAALSIAHDDFNIALAGSNVGTMLGRGCYLGESSTKADEYAQDEPDGYYRGVFAMLLCRVVMGSMYYTTQRDEEAGNKVTRGGRYDSALCDRTKHTGTFREFVVYNADQVYPEYIVLYARKYHAMATSQFQRAISHLPFHMQLPIYWKNGHLDPSRQAFQTHVRVNERTRSTLQSLAQSCCPGKTVEVVSAVRIESSSIWNKYVAYKARLFGELKDDAASEAANSAMQHVLGGGDQVFHPRNGFPSVERVDGTKVLTREVLSNMDEEHAEEALSLEHLVDAVAENFLWHGTSFAAAKRIIQEDFHIPKPGEVTHGSRFGDGAYLAELLWKSLMYAREERGVRCVLLCRALCGNIYHTTERQMDAVCKARQEGRHSVLANPRGEGPREFIMLEEDQVYPEYMLQIRALVMD